MKKYLLHSITILSISLFAFCQTTSKNEPEIIEHFDIPYYSGEGADEAKHKLNLFLPKDVKNFPTVLWIHGGAWAVGGREKETKLAQQFAKRGIGFVPISYRLSPGTWMNPKLTEGIQHPEHAKDCARAFQWLYENGLSYGVDTSKLIISGYSAGGHLSALLCTDESYLKEVGLDFNVAKAAVPIAGGYDMEDYYHDQVREGGDVMGNQHVLAVFGKFENLHSASPTTHIEKATVPMLVVSETDTYSYTKIFEDAANAAEKPFIEFLHVTDMDHSGLFFSLQGEESSAPREQIIKYIFDCFKREGK